MRGLSVQHPLYCLAPVTHTLNFVVVPQMFLVEDNSIVEITLGTSRVPWCCLFYSQVLFINYNSFCSQRGRQMRPRKQELNREKLLYVRYLNIPLCVCLCVYVCENTRPWFCANPVCVRLPTLEEPPAKKQQQYRDEREEASLTSYVTSPFCGLSERERSYQLKGE